MGTWSQTIRVHVAPPLFAISVTTAVNCSALQFPHDKMGENTRVVTLGQWKEVVQLQVWVLCF